MPLRFRASSSLSGGGIGRRTGPGILAKKLKNQRFFGMGQRTGRQRPTVQRLAQLGMLEFPVAIYGVGAYSRVV
jgi:hypothetical protein